MSKLIGKVVMISGLDTSAFVIEGDMNSLLVSLLDEYKGVFREGASFTIKTEDVENVQSLAGWVASYLTTHDIDAESLRRLVLQLESY